MKTSRPIKALLASEFWPGATARSILPALKAKGWQVDQLDFQAYFTTGKSLVGRVKARLSHSHQAFAFNRAILHTAKARAVDVFLTVKGRDITATTIRSLQAAGVLCANFYPDYHFNDIGIDTVAAYDLIATTKSFQLEELRARKRPGDVAFIHHGYSDEFHHGGNGIAGEHDVDVLYAGNAGPEKVAFMIALTESLAGVSFRIVGAGWSKVARGTALDRAEIVPVRSGVAYAAEIARARIILAFHHGADPKTGFADLVSTRTFEIPACGGFMLHIDNDEVHSLYDVPAEIETFTTPENCAAKIRYWLAHPREREAVAARGHARAVPAYGYAARGREFAELIEARLAS